jgi:catechol 2,3-dioxygenase-like lactoylglutathione lyase family enzyme
MPRYSILRTTTAVCAAWLAACAAARGQTSAGEPPGKVVGLAYVGRMVADLDRSVAFYQAIGFTQDAAADATWHRDGDIDRLYGIHGIQLRTARMSIVNDASGQRFVVVLRQLKGVRRQNLAGHTAWEPGATHFSLVVPDAQLLWSQLQAAGMLRARSWGGRLIAPPGQTKGRIAYLTDPDGLDIELLNRRPALPQGAVGSQDPDSQPGVGHAGIVVLDLGKEQAFYGGLLGGQPQKADPPWLKGDFFDSVVGGHGNIMRVYDESFPEATAPAVRLNFALIEFQNRKQPVKNYRITDIGVGYVGFEVTGLNELLRRAKAAGAKVVSKPGPVAARDGSREVMIRDPDVGGFVALFERPKI